MSKTENPYGQTIFAPEYCVNDHMAEFGNEKKGVPDNKCCIFYLNGLCNLSAYYKLIYSSSYRNETKENTKDKNKRIEGQKKKIKRSFIWAYKQAPLAAMKGICSKAQMFFVDLGI